MLEANKIISVYKPEGMTSYEVVRLFKKKYPGIKIGHGGTLDPLAEGVLLILIGKATKQFDELRKLDKEYEMTIEFGWQTDTGDREGKIVKKLSNLEIKKLRVMKKEIKNVLAGFVGEYEQEIPLYSAAKFKGKPLYWYARRGIETPRSSRGIRSPSGKSKKVKIKGIEILGYDEKKKQLTIKVTCSSGTYMRSLAVDIGKKLNVPAVMVKLIRTKIGSYSNSTAHILGQSR